MDRRFFLKLCASLLVNPVQPVSVAVAPAQSLSPAQLDMFYTLIDATIYCCGAKKVAESKLLDREEIEYANNMKSGFQSLLGSLRHQYKNDGYEQLSGEVFQAMKDHKHGIATKYDDLFSALPEGRLEAFRKGISMDEVSWFENALAEDIVHGNLQRNLKTRAYHVVAESEKHWRKVDGTETYFAADMASAKKLIWPGMRNWVDIMALTTGADYLYPDSKASGERQR